MPRKKKVVEEPEEVVEEPVRQKPKNAKEEETKWPPWDHRYTVSLAKKDDPKCYLQIDEMDVFEEAKNCCIDAACDEEREAIVWDNRIYDIVFRYMPESLKVKDDKPPAKATTRKPITRAGR